MLSQHIPPPRGRPRLYPTRAERDHMYYLRKKANGPCAALASPISVCQLSPTCTVYWGDALQILPHLPRWAALVSDPPYDGFDASKDRRRPSHWDYNPLGHDTPFDPRPWLRFPEVVLCGADRYRHHLPLGGAWCCWDKVEHTTPSDFNAAEWIWRSMDGPPLFFPHLWRGGMRRGAANIARLPVKRHPAEKPIELMLALVRLTRTLLVIDPFMGSGTTLEACIRLGRPCIGVEIDRVFYAKACARLQETITELSLQAGPRARGSEIGL